MSDNLPHPSPHQVCGVMLPCGAQIRCYCVRSNGFTGQIGHWLGGSGPVHLAGQRGAGHVRWASAMCWPLLVGGVRELCRWDWLVSCLRRWRPWWRCAPYEGGRCGWVLSLLCLATSVEDVVFVCTGVPHGFADGGHGCGLLWSITLQEDTRWLARLRTWANREE